MKSREEIQKRMNEAVAREVEAESALKRAALAKQWDLETVLKAREMLEGARAEKHDAEVERTALADSVRAQAEAMSDAEIIAAGTGFAGMPREKLVNLYVYGNS